MSRSPSSGFLTLNIALTLSCLCHHNVTQSKKRPAAASTESKSKSKADPGDISKWRQMADTDAVSGADAPLLSFYRTRMCCCSLVSSPSPNLPSISLPPVEDHVTDLSLSHFPTSLVEDPVRGGPEGDMPVPWGAGERGQEGAHHPHRGVTAEDIATRHCDS